MLEENSSKHVQTKSCQTESELNSIVEKRFPIFQLRLNEYSEQDWIRTPVLLPDVKIDLSPKQCEETFKLFLVSGERLSQMTKTYHDIDAVMHLLEEKEKDLELAARIGQTLLTRNQLISNQNELLEEKLATALEKTHQLQYEIAQKEQLLNIYTEADDSADDVDSINCLQSRVNALHNQIQKLKQEKKELLQEKSKIENKFFENNESENRLVSTTVKQLSILQKDLQTAYSQILAVIDELTKCNCDASKQQDEISVLLHQIKELQIKHAQLIDDHVELQQQLNFANLSQVELSQEVQSLEVKYQEVLNMLDDTRVEMRSFRDLSECDTEFANSKWYIPFDNSLAAELKAESISTDNSEVSDFNCEFTKSNLNDQTGSHILNKTFPVTIGRLSKVENNILRTAQYVKKPKSMFLPKLSLSSSLPSSLHELPVTSIPTFSLKNSTPILESPDFGQPGVPGTADLQRAIEKLTRVSKASLKLVQQTHHNLLQSKNISSTSKTMKKCMSAPKLQIVKPLEGSSTLHQWKNLAEESRSFSTSLKISTASGIITRGSFLNSKHQEKTKEPFKSRQNSSQSLFIPTGTSGVLASSFEAKQQLQSPIVNDNTSKIFHIKSKKIKNVHSSPYLPSLTASLNSSSNGSSIIHAVSCSTSLFKQSSDVDLAQLHGCDNHTNSKKT